MKKSNKKSVNLETPFKFFFTFKLASSHDAKGGIPLGGFVIAESLAQATEMARDIIKNSIDTLWNSEERTFASVFGSQVKLIQRPFLAEFEVHKKYLIEDWGDCHNDALRDIINAIWSMPMYDLPLERIMSVYWERDKDELADYFCDECYWWSAKDKSFEEICNDGMYDEMCYQLFSHIFDDADYKAIINYIRPRNISGWDIAL